MKKKINKLQKVSIIAAIATFIIVGVIVIYSLGFLSNNLLRALMSQTSEGEGIVEFNLSGFEALGL